MTKAGIFFSGLCFACAGFGASALGATGVQSRNVYGVTMPETITIQGKTLHLNGMGVRREDLFFKAYVIALYLETPTPRGQAAIQTDEVKRIVITMLRDVGRKAFVQAIEDGVIRNSRAEMPRLRARLDLLEQAVPDLKKGDMLDLTWMTDTGTIVRGQGKTLTLPGKDFADALFSVWLGPDPVEASLKRDLLRGS